MALHLLLALSLLAAFSPSLAQQAGSDPNWVFQGAAVPEDTIRLIALGTGTPGVVHSQVSSSYLLQLGGTRNILLDAGTGSVMNLYATGVDLSTIDTVFLSHLHSDHVTDLGPLYALASGRQRPLTVYGPSGAVPETGTAYLIDGLRRFLTWDRTSRDHVSNFPPGYRGNQLVGVEFNYSVPDQLIFEEGNLTVFSNPAFHYDTPGATSLRVEWNGLSVTYSGDTIALETFIEFSAGSDVVLHESVGPIYNFENEPPAARNIISNHTLQQEVGSVFQAIKPRLAIASHLRVNQYTVTPIISAIREQYPVGPLAIATDFDVWDISPSTIVQRRFLPTELNAGYEFDGYPREYGLATSSVATLRRPATVGPLELVVHNTAPPVAAGG